MISLLKKHNRFNESLFIGFSCILCFALSLLRVGITGSPRFLFLNWNLFLAFLPWMLSTLVIIYPKLQRSKLSLATLLFSWLLFFPNAPYILTDLFHLRLKTSVPVWFDLVLILSFAWTGLLMGFMSLLDIEAVLSRWMKSRVVALTSTALLFIGSFGIYVGRFLRWNSWDIISQPNRCFSKFWNASFIPLITAEHGEWLYSWGYYSMWFSGHFSSSAQELNLVHETPILPSNFSTYFLQ